MGELKPCPFCGGIATIQQDTRYPRYGKKDTVKAYEPICTNTDCLIYKADNVYFTSEKKAIAAWNRRAQPENSRQHALQTGVCPMCEDCPDGCPVETPNDSRNRPENEPPTLDELRQMDGEPVWVQELPPYTTAGYKVLAAPAVNEYGDICFDGGDCYVPYDYGKTWLAYRRKPKEEV